MPLRGRKNGLYDSNQDESLALFGTSKMSVKKASFVPMRGRKDEFVPYDNNDIFYSSLDDYPKRGSFIPLRGRKDVLDGSSDNFR